MRQILFASPQIEVEFRDVDRRIMDVLDYLSCRAWETGKELLMVTCIVRHDRLSEKDTHFNQPKPYRFVDVGILRRCPNDQFRDEINTKFPYGDSQHDTVPQLDHGTGPHFHIQVIHKEA